MKYWKGFRALLGAALALTLVLPAGAEAGTDFVKEVNCLPELETVKKLSDAERQGLYAHVDALWKAGYDALSQADQKELEATEQYAALTALTDYLKNENVSQPAWTEAGTLKIAGTDLEDGVDYRYDEEAGELVILGTKPVLVTSKDGLSTDTLCTEGEAEVVLVNAAIEAPEGKSAVDAKGGVKLMLVGANALTAKDQAAVHGAEGVTLSGTGSLTVQGGTGADGSGASGIGAKSLTVTGGTVAVAGGPGAPGTEEKAGGNGGTAVETDVLTVTGGSLKLTGGKAGEDGGSGAGTDGEKSLCKPTEDGAPLAQTVVTLNDRNGEAVTDTLVTALALTPNQDYGLQGVVTDDTGSIYLYLPEDTKTKAVADGSDTYTGKPIASGEKGIMTLSASGKEDDPVTPDTTATTTELTTETTAPPQPTEPKKSAQSAPMLELDSKTDNSVTLKAPTGGTGKVLYICSTTDKKPDTKDSSWVDNRVFQNLEGGKTYYFFAYYVGDDKTEASPVSEALAVTLQGSFPSDSVKIQGGEKTYDGKSMSLSVTVPDGATVRYREGSSGDYTQSAVPSYTNVGTYTIGYQVTKDGYGTVVGTATIKISPATPTITLADQSFKHDGNTHPMGGAKVTGVNGENFRGSVTYTYYTDGQCTQGETKVPPSAVGTYYVRASIAAGGNYTAAVSNTAKLTIEKSSSTATKPTTGGNTNTPTTGYTITASAGAGGSITQSGKISVQSGKSVSFTVVADKGYEVEEVKVDGQSIGSVGVYTFTNVKANHTIEATFRRTVAETTAPTTEPTTAPTEATAAPTTEETVAETTEAETQPVKKHKIPIIVPILLVILAGGAIGGAVYVYKKYDQE